MTRYAYMSRPDERPAVTFPGRRLVVKHMTVDYPYRRIAAVATAKEADVLWATLWSLIRDVDADPAFAAVTEFLRKSPGLVWRLDRWLEQVIPVGLAVESDHAHGVTAVPGVGSWDQLDAIKHAAERRGEERILVYAETLAAQAIQPPPHEINDPHTAEQRAIAKLTLHPDWTVTQIAESIGCHPKTLSKGKAPRFHAARQAYRAANLPRGSKSADGQLEAWVDD